MIAMIRSTAARRLLPHFFVTALAAIALSGCEKEEPAVEAPQAGPGTTENEILADITGEWRGELRQPGLKPFAVRALIRHPEDPRESLVRYGGIDCSGTWTVIDVRDRTVRFRETIDSGQGGKCKGTGTVEITAIDEERLDYVFRGGGVKSAGVLHRAE